MVWFDLAWSQGSSGKAFSYVLNFASLFGVGCEGPRCFPATSREGYPKGFGECIIGLSANVGECLSWISLGGD